MNFDIEAKNWDSEERVNRAKIIAKEISKAIPINKHYSALEFGCGTGLISFNLHEKFDNITLVDTSKGMIDTLNSKINQYKLNNMTAYNLDINNQQELKSKYDVIYTSMALHHIVEIEIILESLYKLLNKDGYIYIVDLDEEDGTFHSEEANFTGHNGFNQQALGDLLKKIGYSEIETNIIFKDTKRIKSSEVEYSLFLMKGKR